MSIDSSYIGLWSPRAKSLQGPGGGILLDRNCRDSLPARALLCLLSLRV